jgi:hypothetical protein
MFDQQLRRGVALLSVIVFLVVSLGLHLLLLLDRPGGLRSFRELHPSGGQVNHDGPVLRTHHLTRAGEVASCVPAVLFRIHPTGPSSDFPRNSQMKIGQKAFRALHHFPYVFMI